MWQWHYPSQFSWVDGTSDSAASVCSTLDHHGDLLGFAGGPSCASGVYRAQHASTVYSNGSSHNVQYAAGGGSTPAALPAPASSMMAVTAAAGYGQPYIGDCGVLPPSTGLPTSATTTAMAAVSYYGMYGGMTSTESRCVSPGQLDGPWSTYTVCCRYYFDMLYKIKIKIKMEASIGLRCSKYELRTP